MTDQTTSFEFGKFRLLPAENMLTRDGEPIALPPRALAVLDVMIRNAGRVVTKEKLIHDVWNDLTVEDATVARTVWLIRNALGDDPKSHEFIQTVPKRGYRFVADVIERSDATSSQRPALASARVLVFASVAVGLLLFITGAAYMLSSGRSRPANAERGTVNDDAYRLYLQATYAFEKRTPQEAVKAVELFDQAIALDAEFAHAWAGKARAIRYAAAINSHDDIAAEYEKSKLAVDRAISLDPQLSDAYSASCENKLSYEFDIHGAERDCVKAINLKPDSTIANDVYSRFLTSRGRHSEALIRIKKAIDLEPTSIFFQRNFGVDLFYARRYDEAERQLKRVIEMEEGFEATYPWLLATLQMQGKYDEAFEWFIRSKSRKATEEQLKSYRSAYAESGWTGFVREHILENPTNVIFAAACQAALIGDKENALGLLERSFARREWGIAYLDVDPRLDVLRDDPRFESLIERAGIRRSLGSD